MTSHSNVYYTTRSLPMFTKNMIIFSKTTHIHIFHFNLSIVSFHASSMFSQKSRRRCWTIVIEHDSIGNKKWNKIQIEMLQNVQYIANNHGIFH